MGIHIEKPTVKFDISKLDIDTLIALVKSIVESEDPTAARKAVAKEIDDAIELSPVLEIVDRPLINAGLKLLIDAIAPKVAEQVEPTEPTAA